MGLVNVGLVVERHDGWDWSVLDLWLRGCSLTPCCSTFVQ